MSEFDPLKLISLKLATLSARDKKWVLSKLPDEKRHLLEAPEQLVKQVSSHRKSLNFDELLQPQIKANAIGRVKKEAPRVSTSLYAHLQQMQNSKHKITEATDQFISEFLEGKKS